MSNALLEACVEKNAIIASRVGGNIEVIEDKISGILVDPYDIKAQKDALLYLKYNKNKMIEYGEKARARVLNKFNEVEMVKSLSIIYKKIEEKS